MKKGKLSIVILGILLAVLWLFPFYLLLSNSFKTPKGIFTSVLNLPGKFFTISNYPEAYEALHFLSSFLHSLIITVISVILLVFCSALAAYALQRNHSRLSSSILLLFISAMIIPFQSVMIPMTALFGKVHALNMWGLIFMYLGFNASLSIFLFQGSIGSISESLDESAAMEGANRWQVFRKIIFPMLTPMSVTVAVLNIVLIWNDYLLPSLVLPEEQFTIPLQMFMFFGQFTKQWHLAMAGLTLAIIPVIIFYMFSQKYIIKGITEGAVK